MRAVNLNAKSDGEVRTSDTLRQERSIESLDSRYRSRGLPNAMTVDVEEYFQVSAFDSVISREEWPRIPSRIEHSVDKILQLFDSENVKGTFFTLGWILERHPQTIRRIVAAGHEIASHGHEHTRVNRLGRERFRAEAEDSRKRLEDVSGTQVVGYRAPSFSIGQHTPWAHEELAEAGYKYSSSVFPISHDHYGYPDAPRFPYQTASNSLIEIPMSTVMMAGRRWPCAGGGYFRLLPPSFSQWAIRQINVKEGMPAVFYFHPWELDPEQPRVDGLPVKSRFRHYVNLRRFESRLRDVLKEFHWDRVDRVFLGGGL